MKTNILDYILSNALISLIAGAAGLSLWWTRGPLSSLLGDFTAIGMVLLFLLLYGGCSAAALGLLGKISPLREGEYTTDDTQFLLWKVWHVVEELGKGALFLYFPVFLRQGYYALFGTSVGKNVAVAGKILDPFLVTLEDGSVLGEGTILTSHLLAQNRFTLRRIHLEKGALVGIGSILLPGVRVGAGAVILPGSVVKLNTVVPAGETWGGIPAVRVKEAALQ
jgi:acetyltransferase-like isoleucine patch superfamily enzyme